MLLKKPLRKRRYASLLRRSLALTILLSLTAFQSPAPLAQLPRAKVIGVKDGDTIEILTTDKFSIIVRLDEIDCPEKKQAYGERAKQFTSDFCFGKYVRIKSRGRDGFGRILAEVYNDQGVSLNQALVKNGLAWRFVRYSKSPTLEKLQNEARSAKRGLWAEKLPIAPWDFRAIKTKPKTVVKKGGV